MNRIANILTSFEKTASELPPLPVSPRISNIMQKAAICPQMMGIGMDTILPTGDQIEGGLADGKTGKDIAAEQGVAPKDMKEELKEGEITEMEHTDDPKKAKEIAKDHIEEAGPEYYDKLGEMEETLETDKEKGLADPSVDDKEIILRFLQTQSDLDDETLHKLYLALGVDPEEGEEVVNATAADALGDDPAKARDTAKKITEKEVEKGEDEPGEQPPTEEEQAEERVETDEPMEEDSEILEPDADTMVIKVAEVLKKAAEALMPNDRKGVSSDDNQAEEEVPTQITDKSPVNAPSKAVTSVSDQTKERKDAEAAQSVEQNEKVAETRLQVIAELSKQLGRL